jgi:hypothetical protein
MLIHQIAYFVNVHPIYPFLDREQIMSVWDKLYGLPQPRHTPRQVALLSLVVAIGAVCDRETEGLSHQSKQLVDALQDQLGVMFDQLCRRSSVEAVQVMLLQVRQDLQRSARRKMLIS